jgi:hypothetical protein
VRSIFLLEIDLCNLSTLLSLSLSLSISNGLVSRPSKKPGPRRKKLMPNCQNKNRVVLHLPSSGSTPSPSPWPAASAQRLP